MARQIIHQLIDDLDGTELGDEGKTIRFGLDGRDYEIDLSAAHADELTAALAPFVEAGRRAPRGQRNSAPTKFMAGQLEEIRKWARENGYEVADKGRISREVKIAFANKRKA